MVKSEIETRLKVLRKEQQSLDMIANSRKVSINGLFGKLGSPFSVVFAPDLMLQVTLSGQLCLLMLIERLEIEGFRVISGNTDGFITKVPTDRLEVFDHLIREWETKTGFVTEDTHYKAVYSRDVNSFMNVTSNGKVKAKGAAANPWKDMDTFPDYRGMMSLTPTSSICIEAVEARIVHGTPVEQTIRACRDIRKFVSIRTVKGGGMYGDEYLGKAVRWYYGHTSYGCLTYKTSGNKVATTDGAVPIMDLPDEFPFDVNYDRYIMDAREMLIDLGFTPNIDKKNWYQVMIGDMVKEIKKHERKMAKKING